MNCEDFNALLDAESDPERLEQLFAHASRCQACRERLQFDALLRRRLRTQPIPAPRPDYPDRVLKRAHQLAGSAPAWRRVFPSAPAAPAWGVAAASGLLALGLWWNLSKAPVDSAPVPRVASVALGDPTRVQPVRLVFRSPVALSGVTIALGLPEGVELAGYPGQRQLSWQTDLQLGTNLLELPVRVRGEGGVLTATLNLGEDSRQFSVRVQGIVRSGGLGSSPLRVIAAVPRLAETGRG